ncbi:uncharacterized protein [Venturia canescens]|uniref:uncharacterized protein n=1 Tax=Venturia canescens TaxID=32260 RepID=UPI001C9CA70A|nr:uncharacterized protein LOC122411983 [Venturia canescens]
MKNLVILLLATIVHASSNNYSRGCDWVYIKWTETEFHEKCNFHVCSKLQNFSFDPKESIGEALVRKRENKYVEEPLNFSKKTGNLGYYNISKQESIGETCAWAKDCMLKMGQPHCNKTTALHFSCNSIAACFFLYLCVFLISLLLISPLLYFPGNG